MAQGWRGQLPRELGAAGVPTVLPYPPPWVLTPECGLHGLEASLLVLCHPLAYCALRYIFFLVEPVNLWPQ